MKARTKCAVGVGLVAAIAIVLFHTPVLRGLAGFLVANEPVGSFQYVGLFTSDHKSDGPGSWEAAAELYAANKVRRIVLFDNREDRLVETGVVPSFETLIRDRLGPRGTPAEAFATTRSDGFDDWARARAIRAWIVEHPKATLLVLCGRFHSAHLRHAIDTLLDPDAASRVGVLGMPNQGCDETNWWTSRAGVKAFGFAWLRRIHGWLLAGGCEPPTAVGADQYERDVCKRWMQ